ncbi:1141_t:CDS:2, partial [Dentiscutata heterogama]
AMSRLWGKINNEYILPVWMREPCYKLYSWLFSCNLDEVENPDLKAYPNLGSFFIRSLKPGVRPIDNNAILVSPSDGRIINFGLINDGWVEPIKGNSYSLSALLGRDYIDNANNSELPIDISPDNTYKWQINKKENGLFYCTIYLAPGDYHRFHSPTNWVVEAR